MAKLIITRGLPGSGKSYEAEQLMKKSGNYVRVNKDLLRTMLHFDIFNHRNEDKTQDASKGLVKMFLKGGTCVIVDDTNLNPKVLQSYKEIAKECGANIEYLDMTHLPVEVCIERDKLREKKVGAHVIQRMALQYLDYMKGENIVVSDMDGTLADCEHRREYSHGEKKDWNKFFELTPFDTLRSEVLNQINDVRTVYEDIVRTNNRGIKYRVGTILPLIIVSARPERCRKDTEEWLEKNKVQYDMLLMRPDSDSRDDTVVKAEIYDKYLSKMNILEWYDDRPKIIRMLRTKGVNVKDVGNGVEFQTCDTIVSDEKDKTKEDI